MVSRVAFAVAVGIVLLLLLEGTCRVFGIGAPSPFDDPARGFLPIGRLFEEHTDERGVRVLEVVGATAETALGRRLQFNPLRVPVEKPRGELRIVCVGGSMTYGWPWDDRTSFPRLLEVGLRAMRSHPDVRVINLGAPGWGTTRIALIAEEIAELQPDVVVVTCGTNEAVELAFSREVFAAGRSRVEILQALSRRSYFANGVRRAVSPARPATPESLMARPVLALTDVMRAELVERFEANLRVIAERIGRHGARVYVSADPANERDCPPFTHDAPGGPDGGAQDRVLVAEFARAAGEVGRGEFEAAIGTLQACRAACPRSAQVAFLFARALRGAGRISDARAAFREAIELDVIALRAFGALVDAVERVAASPGVGRVDMVSAMRQAAEDGIPGDDLFVDNCHLNDVGTRVPARAVAERFAADGLIAPAPGDWERFTAAVEAWQRAQPRTPESEVPALKFLLGYYRVINPDPGRAASLQGEIERLDPARRLADDEFRRSFFR